VSFVERLGERERGFGREAETAVRFALQARQVVEKRRKLRGGLRLLGGNARLSQAFRADGGGPFLLPQSLGSCLGILFVLLEVFVEPATGVLACRGGKRGVDFPIAACLETAYTILALDENCERRCLHTADRGLVKAASLRVEGCHGTRAVDSDEPVRLGAAQSGVGQGA